jgi:cell division protein FtsI (penicillin-binding protein 3)
VERRKEFLVRVYFMLGVFTLLALGLMVKAFMINVLEGKEWKRKSKELYFTLMAVKAERGKILADDGSPLATSQPIFEIRMDTRASGLTEEIFLNNVDSLASCIRNYLQPNRTKAEIKSQLIQARKKSDRYVFIAKNLNYNQLQIVKSFPIFRNGPNRGGIITITENRREKPYKHFASRTIGLDRENAESVGLEKTFNKFLKGKEGQRVMRKVGHNIYIPVNGLEEIGPQKGQDVITTINPGLQEIAHLALEESIIRHQAEEGCVVLMEVATGAVKAIANLSWNDQGELVEAYNHAIAKSSEPGSTFKLASLLALLEDGKIDTNTAVDLNGGAFQFYDRVMKDSRIHGLRMSNAAGSFIHSSNVGISKLTFSNFSKDPKRFVDYLQKFGLDQKTGIELEGEPDPLVKDPVKDKNKWYGTTLPWMSVGYELQITPLQLLTFYNGIANRGKFMKPYLVSDIYEGNKAIKHFEPIVLRDSVISKSSLDKIFQVLQDVVLHGTAKDLQNDVYTIAGKTGTAVTNYFHATKETKSYQASFAGFFPAGNPLYSCIVVIYNPKQMGYYGSEVAAPVFKRIADRCMRNELMKYAVINDQPKVILTSELLPVGNKGYASDFVNIFKQIGMPLYRSDAKPWVTTVSGDDGIYTAAINLDRNRMPDLRGMGLRDAMYVMDAYGVKLIPNGMGKIVAQSIPPGVSVSDFPVQLFLE